MLFHTRRSIKMGLLLLMFVLPVRGESLTSLEQLIVKADKGNVQAMFDTGVRLLNMTAVKGQPGKALKYLEQVATDSTSVYSTRAKVWLGRAYRDALAGTPKDNRLAFSYFEQAAGRDGKDPVAQFELGKAYLTGTGTDRNLIAAYMWTSLSLKQPSSITKDAEKQQQQLAGMLNTLQLEKAGMLVNQLETVYLN